MRKFVAAAKKAWFCPCNSCQCNSCQNKLLHEDSVVQSHLILHGFVENYTVCKFHGKGDPSVTGASERNSSTTTSPVNERGQQPSSSAAATAGGDSSANRDYINIDELLQDIADNDGDDENGDEQGDCLEPEDVEIFENLANCMDQDDVLFGNPKWLENFKEIKQAAIDPLYKDCPNHWMALR